MNKEFYVYADYRLDNMTVCYIGKGKGDRFDIAKRNPHHDSIMNKYGIVRVKLYENLTESRAFLLEKCLISHFVYTLGYSIDIKGFKRVKGYHLTNQTFGGEGISGLKHSDITKQKISEGEKGKTVSEETRKKQSDAQKGKKLSDETKNKISKSMKGENNPMYSKHHNEETKQKISESKKGKKNPCYGRTGEKHPMFGRKGADNPKSIKVIAFTDSKSYCKEFAGTKEAERELAKIGIKVQQPNICKCIKGTRKSAGRINGEPIHWRYKEDEEDKNKIEENIA